MPGLDPGIDHSSKEVFAKMDCRVKPGNDDSDVVQRFTMKRIISGWASANDYFVGNPDAALDTLQKKYYKQVPITDLKEQFGGQKMFTSAEWKKLYADGTVTQWLQQVTDFFVRFANISNPVPASQYFDSKLYLETIKG